MPILQNMKTVWVDDDPWKSPDGKVTVWNIKLEDSEGEREMHSTMSKVIAQEGWKGDIEIYTNQKGKDYVRQAPKEEKPSYQPKQESPETQEHIARSVALKAAVDAHGVSLDTEDILRTADRFLNWLQDTGSQGKHAPEATKAPAPPEARDSEEPDAEWSLDNMPIPPEENEEGGSTRDWERLGKK